MKKQLLINQKTHKELSMLKVRHGKETLSDAIDYLMAIEKKVKSK